VDLEAADTVWAAAAGPDGSLTDYLDALRECVEQLEGRARHAVNMHYRENYRRESIAAALDMKPDGVKTLPTARDKYCASASNAKSKPNHPISAGRQTESSPCPPLTKTTTRESSTISRTAWLIARYPKPSATTLRQISPPASRPPSPPID
jgi:hypothetical protein